MFQKKPTMGHVMAIIAGNVAIRMAWFSAGVFAARAVVKATAKSKATKAEAEAATKA